jgi:hypothetical protein
VLFYPLDYQKATNAVTLFLYQGKNIAPVHLIARNAKVPENLPTKVLGWGLTVCTLMELVAH